MNAGRLLLLTVGLLASASPAVAAELPKTVAEALALERAEALPMTGFYSDPAPLTGTKPGDLLRREAFAGYSVVKGMTAVRILYHSLDASRHDVVTSGVVLIPPGNAPAGGWPVIAWGHGTSGVAMECAPSLMTDVYYGPLGLAAMLEAGFVVVATDYHGLGTAGPHQYGSKLAQALDIVYSVPAARAAVPELGVRWVAVGHSQGGVAAWGVAELESGLKDDGYVGAVSVAGAVNENDVMQHFNESTGGSFYLAFLAYGIKARFPAFGPGDVLAPPALQRYPAATSGGCWYNALALYRDVPAGTALRPDWRANAVVRRFTRQSQEGTAKISKPLLVLAGEADAIIPIEGVRRIVRQACRAGGDVTFRSYPGLDHTPVMVDTTADQIAWIRERMAGVRASSTCSVH